MGGYFRNCLCPEYSGCLDVAAKKNLLLDCSQCPRRTEKYTTLADVQGCKGLLAAVFHPNIFCTNGHHNLTTAGALDTIHDNGRNRIIQAQKNFY